MRRALNFQKKKWEEERDGALMVQTNRRENLEVDLSGAEGDLGCQQFEKNGGKQ